VGILLASGDYVPFTGYYSTCPVELFLRPRWSLVVSFALALLAGYGTAALYAAGRAANAWL
jgi:hypothetical protein